MAKKLFVRRDLHKRRRTGAPYLKYLVFAALALIFLVVVTPYLLKNKSRQTTEKRPLPNRGAITKVLPKMAQTQPVPEKPALPSPDTATPGAVKATVPGAVKATAPGASTTPEAPGSVKPTQTQVAAKPADKAPATTKQASPAETTVGLPSAAPAKPSTPAQPAQEAQAPLFPAQTKVSTPVHTTETPHTSPKVLFPKTASRSNALAAKSRRAKAVEETAARRHRAKTAFSAKPAPKPGIRHGAGHPFHPSVNEGYAVQVGSIFRTYGQARALQKKLASRGYRTSIHSVARLGYLVVTPPGARSKAYTLLVQMNAEGLTNAKVVPVDLHAR